MLRGVLELPCMYTFRQKKVHQLIELDYEQIEPERSESKQATRKNHNDILLNNKIAVWIMYDNYEWLIAFEMSKSVNKWKKSMLI